MISSSGLFATRSYAKAVLPDDVALKNADILGGFLRVLDCCVKLQPVVECHPPLPTLQVAEAQGKLHEWQLEELYTNTAAAEAQIGELTWQVNAASAAAAQQVAELASSRQELAAVQQERDTLAVQLEERMTALKHAQEAGRWACCTPGDPSCRACTSRWTLTSMMLSSSADQCESFRSL